MITSDFLVIGSGIAGLNFALQASEFGSVCLITKKDLIESNTNFAQGGIAAVLSKLDSFDLHVKDTVTVGDGLSDEEAVKLMVKNAPKEIRRLVSLGVDFDRKGEGMELGKEGAHSRKRIVHRGDKTGMEVEKSLVHCARKNRNIRVFEKHLAFELVMENGRCIGARAIDKEQEKVKDFFARAVALATGGLCEVYQDTSNPDIATGDGVAMGYRAGCEVEDIEFVQFHPTTLRRKDEPFFIISEAVRGEGGVLLNSERKRFVDELASRDVVSMAMLKESREGGVFVDISHKDRGFLRKRFPKIYETCMEHGIDMAKDMIPVEPAAHYSCGGLKTDTNGRTNVEGLFALGEVACTGVHGANRLASNSLLESLVFSSRAVEEARKCIRNRNMATKEMEKLAVFSSDPGRMRNSLKEIMWNRAGMVREGKGLEEALEKIEGAEKDIGTGKGGRISPEMVELGNMVLVSKLIVRAALEREESRGTHFRKDFPEKRKDWEKHIMLKI